jgi:hypothetical protein
MIRENGKYAENWFDDFEVIEHIGCPSAQRSLSYVANVMGHKRSTGGYGSVAQVVAERKGLFNYEARRTQPDTSEPVRSYTKRGAIKSARQMLSEIVEEMKWLGALVS